MMRWAIRCLLSVIIRAVDDPVQAESVWCFSTLRESGRQREGDDLSEIILITFSRCAQIKVGVSAVAQLRLPLKFMTQMGMRQADRACLISYPFGPPAAGLWGIMMLRQACHLSKAISGWGARAPRHCNTVNMSTLSKRAIFWGVNRSLDRQDQQQQ